jgi:CHAD domain-containing protein
MRALFDKRLTPFTQALAGVRTWDVEAIHQSRIGSRRLRELVPLLELDHETQRSIGRQLRRVTRRLGKLRELDVLAKTLGELRRKGHAGHAIDHLEATVAGEILRTRDWLTRRLEERRLTRLEAALEQIAGELRDRETTSRSPAFRRPRVWQSAIDARLARRAHRLHTAIDRTGAMYSSDALHSVRIALKKLRYALEVSLEASGRKDPATLALLKGAQNTLGRLHDLEMLISRIRATQLDAEFELLSELKALADEAELECRQLHGQFMKDRASLDQVARGLSRAAANASAFGKQAAG